LYKGDWPVMVPTSEGLHDHLLPRVVGNLELLGDRTVVDRLPPGTPSFVTAPLPAGADAVSFGLA
jgi:hypothetical protein